MGILIIVMNLLAIPDDISINALYTIIPCIIISIYTNFLYGHNTLCITYSLLLITSVLYWTNTSWENMMYIDITVALLTICLMSFIAFTRFSTTFICLWFGTLCIMVISFMTNRNILLRRLYTFDTIEPTIIGDLIDKYYPITYVPYDSVERISVYKTSTHMHMIIIHLLPTVVFIVGLYISCNDEV